jgi:hypothetical protein
MKVKEFKASRKIFIRVSGWFLLSWNMKENSPEGGLFILWGGRLLTDIHQF